MINQQKPVSTRPGSTPGLVIAKLAEQVAGQTNINHQQGTKPVPTDFGPVAPDSDDKCDDVAGVAFSDFASSVVIGNKPICTTALGGNETLDTADAFRGKLYSVYYMTQRP